MLAHFTPWQPSAAVPQYPYYLSEERHGERAKLEDYEMKITGMYGGDATKRKVAEVIKIQHTQGQELINRQDEWRQVRLPRIQMCL